MSTPLMQASSTQVSSLKPQAVNILEARPSDSANQAAVSFQLATTYARTPEQNTSDSLQAPLLSNEERVQTEMMTTSMDDTQSPVSSSDPQFFSGGSVSPVIPSTEATSLIGASLSHHQAPKDTFFTLNEAKLDKPLSMPAAGSLSSSTPASFSHTDSGMRYTTTMNSVSENNNSFQLAASANEPISQLSRNQSSKEILPIALVAPNSAQPSTTNPQHALHFGAPAQVQSAEWASIKVDTSAAKWGEQMMQVLHDRVTLQAQQSMQEARIRLDPPELGKLNLIVRVEGDTLNVQINANAASTREALVQVSDRLRTELQNQNFLNVNVNVGSDDSNQQQTAQQELDEFTIFSARDTSQPDSLSNLSEHWLSTQA